MTEPVDPSEAPFVGLRPFDTSDWKWFCGRDRETAALTQKVRNSRFTAVVGPSGSGKSSIVRAGVVPKLQAEGWRKVVTTPGSSPLASLALALCGLSSSDRLVEARKFRFDAMLRASTFGLAEIAETLRQDAPKLLLVVDQFEELFRYGDESAGVERAAMREEARAFIELLLTAANREGGNMHVCITMRSDYFGNCSEYVGLAEALSASQFLVPLPLRGQMEEAIRLPVSRAGGAIEEALVQRLLVDVAEEVDQLPLLQHTLRRLWEKASGSPPTMHEGDYVAVGKIAGSIDKKADDILKALTAANPVDGVTVKRVMKALTDLDERDRATRRPQKLSELRALVTEPLSMDLGIADAWLTRVFDALKTKADDILRALTAANSIDGVTVKRVMKALTQLDEHDCATRRTQKRSELRDLASDPPSTDPSLEASLTRVLDAFKAKDTSFLHFDGGDDPEIEIGHEALIRSWKRLAGAKLDFSEGWLREERNDGDRWRGYVRRAGEQDNPLGWRGQRGLDRWLSERSIGEIWSQRYGNRWADVRQLQATSATRSLFSIATAAASILALLVVSWGIGSLVSNRQGEAERKRLVKQEAEERRNLLDQAEERTIVSSARNRLGSEGPAAAILTVEKVQLRNLPPGPEAERLLFWSLHQLREKYILTGHLLPVLGTAVSPNGRLIVTADSYNLFFWNSGNGSKIDSIDFRREKVPFGQIVGVQWSPRGDRIAVSSAEQTLLMSPCSRTLLKEFLADECKGKGETEAFIIGAGLKAGRAKFSKDGRWLVTGGVGATPKRWDMEATGEKRGQNFEYSANIASPTGNGFALSEGDSPAVAVGDKSGSIQVFDFASGATKSTIEANGEVNGIVTSLAFNPRSPAMLAAAFQDGNLLVWDNWKGDARDSPRFRKLQGTKGIAYQISFTNNGELLMATSDDGTPLVWETASLGDPHPWELRGHFGPVYTAAFSPDGEYLVTGSTDKSAIVWNERPALHEEALASNSSSDAGTSNATSECFAQISGHYGPEIGASPGWCVKTANDHVFFVSPRGKVEEFDNRDKVVAVDVYDAYHDGGETVGLRLDKDRLVISRRSGPQISWPYFDDFDHLLERAKKSLPLADGKPVRLEQVSQCASEKNC